jgi:hypothetical protein
MKARNVIISLFFVIALWAFTLVKVRYWEPKKKITFKRNINSVNYTKVALCLMDCQQIDANDISQVIRAGEIISYGLNLVKGNCRDYVLSGANKRGARITVHITQCGNISKVTNCYITGGSAACNCEEIKMKPV